MAMPYAVFDELQLVVVTASRMVDAPQMSGYENAVRHDKTFRGYDDLCDLTKVESFALESVKQMRAFATFAASLYSHGIMRKLVIAAPTDISFGVAQSCFDLSFHIFH